MANDKVYLAQRWFDEVWNQRRIETINELLDDDSVCHSELGQLRGPQEFRTRSFDMFVSAFPDLQVTVEGTISEGDEVAVRWCAKGTHLGDGLGFPPTGRPISFSGITWIRFRGDKMVEGKDCWNQSGVIQALRDPVAACAVTS